MLVFEVCDFITNKSIGVISFDAELLPAIEAFIEISKSIYIIPKSINSENVRISNLDAFLHWLKDNN